MSTPYSYKGKCGVCGADFESKKPGQRTCSRKCGWYVRRGGAMVPGVGGMAIVEKAVEKVIEEKPEVHVEKESHGAVIQGRMIGMVHERKMIRAAIKNRIPGLMIGETGTGKTSLVKEVAGDMGREVVRVNLDGSVTPDALIGRYQARAENGVTVTYFEEGVIPRAMRTGAVLILDEINAALPDTLFVLHPLLEEEPRLFISETQTEIIPHENFAVIATMNPSHDYAGTKGLNAALFSRFGVVVRFEPMKGLALMKAISAHVPAVKLETVQKLVALMEEARTLREKEEVSTRLTLRECIAAAKLSCDGLNETEAINTALVSKLEKYEVEKLRTWSARTYPKIEGTLEELLARAERTAEVEAECAALTRKLAKFSRIVEALDAAKEEEVAS